MDVATETPVRCAPWTREQGVDPIGSMGIYESFLLVEWPLPWPRDIGEVPALGELHGELAAAGCRLQGVVPSGDSAQRRVVRYFRDSSPFVRFERRELVVAPSEVIAAARHLLADPTGSPAGGAAAGTTAAPMSPSPEAAVDVLVCTHGRRDRCCGSMGTELALELAADPDRLGPLARARRTSHTGGHRFAPTAMVLPDGTGWAFADMGLLSQVVQRQGPVGDVLSRYRGCAGMGSPRIQVLERAVLGEVGWDLLDLPRWGSEEPDGTVRLHVERSGATDTWEATVGTGRVLPVPECGAPFGQARKTATEFVVGEVRRL